MEKRGKDLDKFHSIKVLLVSIIIGVTLVTAIGLETFSVINTVKNNEKQTESYSDRLLEDIQMQLKYEVDIAWSVIDQIHKKQESGELTEEEAKKQAADIVRELRFNEGNGYFWIDTTEGINVVQLGDTSVEGKSRYDAQDQNGIKFMQEIIKVGQEPGGGYAYFSFPKPGESEATPNMSYSLVYEPYQWVIGTAVWIDSIDSMKAEYQENAHNSLKRNIFQLAVFVLVLVIFLCIFAIYIGNRIAVPIQYVTAELQRMASGDFTVKENAEQEKRLKKDRSEIGRMAEAEKILHQSIRTLMEKIIDTISFVASASEELTALSGQSADASETVAQSCTGVAGSCDSQMHIVENANGQVQNFSESMEHFKTMIQSFGDTIKNTNQAAADGGANMEDAAAQMKKIEEAVDETSKVISDLGEQLGKIGSIVGAISDIASQTNLLSLNASIEAARAGEAGKGFAVVASEIRNLADESNEAADKITEMIHEIQISSDAAVQAMERGLSCVESGSKVVLKSGDTFHEIVHMVSEVSSQSEQMEEIVTGLSEGTEKVKKYFEEIDEMSKKVAGETSNVSATSEEQTASAQEIADSSDQLAQTAQELQEFVQEYHL